MAMGGMRDHIGGGFHRYSVDGDWRVPHFEKMLYDQAQLVLAYLEAAQMAGDPFFAQVAEDTLQYVLRDMTSPTAAFYSAEDADSVPPEHAGAAGGAQDRRGVLPVDDRRDRRLLPETSQDFELRYGVAPNGNAPFDPQHEFEGRNILFTARSIADIARETGAEPGTVAAALLDARVAVFQARQTRPRPERDDKVLTAWNGLMIAAAARAARLLDGGDALEQTLSGENPGTRHLRAARRAADFLQRELWDANRQVLRRRYRGGEAANRGVRRRLRLPDVGPARTVSGNGRGALARLGAHLARPAGPAVRRRGARRLVLDDRAGPCMFSSGRRRNDDGAEPSASSVAALNCLTLRTSPVRRAGVIGPDAPLPASAAACGRKDGASRSWRRHSPPR